MARLQLCLNITYFHPDMKVEGKDFTTIWLKDEDTISIIDQRFLPHSFVVEDIHTADEMVTAIRDMHVRGGRPDRSFSRIWHVPVGKRSS